MTSPPSDDPAIVVACPRCGAVGRVRFSRLPHVIRCPKCEVRFWIDSTGHVKSEDEAKLVRFMCPRCGHKEWMPVDFLATGAACPSCRGRFFQGADGDFHAASHEAAESKPPPRRPAGEKTVARRRPPWRLAGLALLPGLLLTFAWVGWSATAPESARAAALGFTKDCLAGHLDAARARVAPDPQRRFEGWAAINFPSAADPLAPRTAAPPVSILEVRTEEDQDISRVRVLIGEEGAGRRLQTQYWRRHDARWLFDATQTLAALESVDTDHPATRPAPNEKRDRPNY